ncbi:DUF262 domain-containing protein [Corynebacterium falsenii]|uniref:DUF262 domain-containing protein n=1 Tax=Corynebacterium falsenii TaxID=108486 RepID=A0A418Q4P0_9CORY|nr:DUF262 domain-containing protein [Corynebacterium falsenii]RIX33326.1 DUF262 domain-containing protein [Corynebacterium falsenii]
MSKLNIDQQSVLKLFSDKRSDFLIPDYQRPYAWGEDQLVTLWDDILAFAIPQGNADAFDSEDEYFLGPIVTFRNSDRKLEIIDGQQRLTTLMILLRAFYAKFENQKDNESKRTLQRLAECLWKTDEFGEADRDCLKIDSEVASDDDKEEFLFILKTGEVTPGQKSKYAAAFNFFKDRIEKFALECPSYIAKLAIRVLNNLILLPIEAESQGTALRIFSTLNDRGLPLSDADIFKSQFYKYFSQQGRKVEFVQRWRDLEETSKQVFASSRANPVDELFTRYMYYERACRGIRDTTTQGLRDFFEANDYELLKNEETLNKLESLLGFWVQVSTQDDSVFSPEVLRRLFVLHYAPNRMWTFFVSVYFMHNRDAEGKLDQVMFEQFLTRTIGFIWAYAIDRPGVNALRSPIFPEMVRLVNDEPVTFENYKFTPQHIREVFTSYRFTNARPVTKSMLVWWAFQGPEQEILDLETKLEIEHIYAKRRAESEASLSDDSLVEALGNKAFLEKRVNIRASDYRFVDKYKYYVGSETLSGRRREGTKNVELVALAHDKSDFVEADIKERTGRMIDSFVDYLDDAGLLQSS